MYIYQYIDQYIGQYIYQYMDQYIDHNIDQYIDQYIDQNIDQYIDQYIYQFLLGSRLRSVQLTPVRKEVYGTCRYQHICFRLQYHNVFLLYYTCTLH
jgi:hypothetical protein